MMETLLAVDPYKKNAYSEKVCFDLTSRSLNEAPSSVIVPSHEEYNPEVSMKKTPSKDWELDVRPMISTKKWLQNYGLQRNRLSLFQLLPTIGFKMSDNFDRVIKRPVASKYAEGLFNQLQRADGKMFNVTCGREKLHQIEHRLHQAINLYKRRLEWLTTESRRVFGVIEERAITIVLDIRNMSPQQFDLYRMALERVLYEQVTQLAKFNLIRASDNIKMYQEDCVPVTHDTIQGAVKWLWDLDRLAGVSSTACVEAVLRACEDRQNEAVYLYTEGSSIDSNRELLMQKMCALESKPPVHVVSYNCENSDTVRFLREFAKAVGGRFHVYAVIMEMDSYEGQPVDPKTNRANIVLKRKTFGGIPPGAGMRDDVIELFQELEEARMCLVQIEKLIGITPEPNIILESDLAPVMDRVKMNEQYMSSRQWLEKYGLAARKLELFDVLSGVAFKHKDGVVDLKTQPGNDFQTDAINIQKLVNAKYCDRFPVVRWRDGKVVHVQVTPELHRNYEQKMMTALRCIQQRIDWLNQGSRALFGTVIEEQIYILIDTSESMVPSIQYVKDKLFLLMQEQLRHKMKFNLIAFNSKAQVWQNRLVEVNETSLEGAWRWIQGLTCWGSTNTYGALQHALGDPGTQAIYLLTDGRPDQPPKSIIAQVQMQHSVPVHTISFNCNDAEANRFLSDLARATGGRYHYFSEKGGMDLEGQPESWESEDIRLLKDTLRKGLDDLDKVAELRDECAKLSWKKEIDNMKKCSKNHPLPKTDRVSAVPSLEPTELYRSESPVPRPSSAPPDRKLSPTPPPKTATSMEFRSSISTVSSRHKFGRPTSARPVKFRPASARPGSAKSPERPVERPLAAGHTRTSLLRTLNSSGSFNADEWLLPETRQLFEKQAARQKKLAQVEARMERAKKAERRKYSKLRNISSKQWLWKHGLIAKKLTLLDALAPTFIPHKAKYVPILDKHVLSKVFDEVLPIAHVSNKSRRPLKLINPNAANLEDYEAKLKKAIDLYNRRLDGLVWEALPTEVKEEEFGEDTGPVSFIKNRSWFIKALEAAHWPVSEQDVLVLEEEIAKGQRFLQQSRDLRKAANPGNHGDDDEITVYDDKASNISGLSARSKELSPSKESLSSTSSSSSSSSKDSEHSKVSEHSKTSTQHTEIHIRKRPKFVRKPPEGGSGTARSDGTDVSTQLESPSDRVKLEMGGPRVLACYCADGLYYPAHVQKPSNAMYAVVLFNFKKRQKVKTKYLVPIGGAVPRPELAEGDFVLVRVYNQIKNLECYVPAIVEFLPEDQRHPHKFYSVLMFNGQRASTMRRYLVKIGKDRFTKAVEYIAQIQQYAEKASTVRSDEGTATPRDSEATPRDSEATPRDSGRHTETEQPRRSTGRTSRSGSSSASGSESRSSRKNSRSSSRSRSRSKSSRSRSSSRSKSRSRSRSKSSSRSSRHRSKSGSRSGSSSSRSRSRSETKTQTRPISRSSTGSQPKRRKEKRRSTLASELDRTRNRSFSPPPSPIERPHNPVPRPVHSRIDLQEMQNEEKDKMITELQYQLEKQTRRQLRQERRMVRQARKINKIQRKLKDTDLSESVQSDKSSRSDVVRDRSKRSPDGISHRETTDTISDNNRLSSLDGNKEVLARWSDDGWYYHGHVIKEGKHKCIVQDATGYHEGISKDDIIVEADHNFNVIQPHDCVIGLHPNYIYSYAPGEVYKVSYSTAVTVEFYDGVVAELPKREVFKISRQKFNSVKDYILDRERKLIGKSVVARDDHTGHYKLGVIDSKEREGQNYRVKWLDGTVSTQSSHHTFPVQQNRIHYTDWNYVLAPTEQPGGNILYKPAKVVLAKPLQVLFCDGTSSCSLKLNECFWISEDYYQNAEKYMLARNCG